MTAIKPASFIAPRKKPSKKPLTAKQRVTTTTKRSKKLTTVSPCFVTSIQDQVKMKTVVKSFCMTTAFKIFQAFHYLSVKTSFPISFFCALQY